MASIHSNPIPGVGMGIIAPNLCYRFSVRFLDDDKQKLPISDQLSNQVVRIDGIEQRVDRLGVSNHGSIIDFQDDFMNYAFKGLLKLQEMESFTVAVDILDGADTILRTTYLRNAKLHSFAHADLDYSGRTVKAEVEVDAHFPQHVGEITNLISENPVAAAVLATMQGAQIRINAGKNLAKPVSSELSAYFSYESTEFYFK